ncbi:MAG: DUF167 domain-containing protein [Woeseiaceae bacterium]
MSGDDAFSCRVPTLSPVGVKLQVKVVAGSSRSCIAGWLGDTLRIRVSAPPERGKANAAVEALLSETLGLSVSEVKIVSGTSSPRKVVRILGLSEAEIRRKLADADA